VASTKRRKRAGSIERATTWSQLIDQLFADSWNPELQRFRSPFAFRGLASTSLKISNSLRRLAGHASISTLELSLLRNFRKYAHGEPAGVESIWHWLALGQHYGLPTRLIDWTYSPFVALHFVTATPDSYGDDGVVLCVNFVEANKLLPKRLKAILEEEHSQTLTIDMLAGFKTLKAFDALARDPFVVFIEPPSLDTRILNQFALFSLMPDADGDLEAWLEEHPDLCRRVLVPAELKREVRDMLDQANINERTLFPGLDGLSQWLERYYTPKSAPIETQAMRKLLGKRTVY
jgi:hypothetical protein